VAKGRRNPARKSAVVPQSIIEVGKRREGESQEWRCSWTKKELIILPRGRLVKGAGRVDHVIKRAQRGEGRGTLHRSVYRDRSERKRARMQRFPGGREKVDHRTSEETELGEGGKKEKGVWVN